jgi:hypothetical protein
MDNEPVPSAIEHDLADLEAKINSPLVLTYWLYDPKGRPVITVAVQASYKPYGSDRLLSKFSRGIAICSLEDIRAQAFTKKHGGRVARARAEHAYVRQEMRLPITSLRALKIVGAVLTTLIHGQSAKLQGLPFTHKGQAGPRLSLTAFEAQALEFLFKKRKDWYVRECSRQTELAAQRLAVSA